MPTMTIILDELDYATIQAEIALRQRQGRTATLPDEPTGKDGESDLAGAMIAEMVRDLIEYRDLYEAEHTQ